MEIVIYFTLTLLLLLPVFILRRTRGSKRLPPGSLGIPLIGQSLSLLKAMRTNKGEEWLQERITKYGPISKLGVFGYPTIFLHGQAANKFIYTCDGNLLSTKQPPSISRILGEKNIIELSGEDHKRVEPLMKILTFNVICSLIFGIESGTRRDELGQLYQNMIAGVLAVPVNLPFTQFRRSLEARARLNEVLMDLIREKRLALEENRVSRDQDLITSLLSIRSEDNSVVMSDEEIMDNISVVMIAGHDTTSILLTFLVRLLAENPSVYAAIVRGNTPKSFLWLL